MANNDLVKKKPVALELDTYARLSKLAAQLRINNPGGGFVSMSAAVSVLLNAFEQQILSNALNAGWNNREKGINLFELLYATKDLGGLTPDEITALDAAIEECKPVSLHDYAANAEANDPQSKTGWAGIDPDEFFREHGYRTNLEPENETE